MKRRTTHTATVILLMMIFPLAVVGQSKTQSQTTSRDLQYYRPSDQLGIGVFEPAKQGETTGFTGVRARLGGGSTLQFQGLGHENGADSRFNDDGKNLNELIEIGSNFNLATANLDFDVQLADGVRMHLRTYLSSRHHGEAWVKGGYIQFDALPFFNSETIDNIMKSFRIKMGHMEINYGDAHFRRSDNGMTIHNPLVGNYIMDAFTTEVGGELYYMNEGVLAMVGMTNGKLNQSVTNPGATKPSILGKLGYDTQVNDDLRVRLTGSLYHTSQSASTHLYGGDRSGSRYYYVLENIVSSSSKQFTSGRFNPGLRNELTAIMINPFVKYKGLEFFGMYESASGKAASEASTRRWTQISGEVTYRFGSAENIYAVARYTKAYGPESGSLNDLTINRVQIGGGWFLSRNVLAKVEYVNQTYDGFDSSSIFYDGSFDGVMLEAVISF